MIHYEIQRAGVKCGVTCTGTSCAITVLLAIAGGSTALAGMLWRAGALCGEERKRGPRTEELCSSWPTHGNLTACMLLKHGFFWGRKYKCVSSHLMLWGREKAHRLPCSVNKNTALAFSGLCYINTRSADILISLPLRAELNSNLKRHPLPILSPT